MTTLGTSSADWIRVHLRSIVGGLAAVVVVLLFGPQPPMVSFLVGFAVAFFIRPRRR